MEHHVGVGARDDVGQLGVPDAGRDEGEATGAVVSVGQLQVGGGGPAPRLSTPVTWCPSSSRRSTRVEPMNPAAPVTRVRIISYLRFDGELWTAATGLRAESAMTPRRDRGARARAVQTATRWYGSVASRM
jgi:hypothetical protein